MSSLSFNDIVSDLLDRARGAPEQRTKEWLEERQNAITASEFGAALGVNKYESAGEYIRKKACRFTSPTTEAMAWGTMFEPLAADLYTRLHCPGFQFVSLPFLLHSTHRWLGASPDGLLIRRSLDDPSVIEEAHLVEIKCPLRRKPNGSVPTEYFAQMQLQMDVCNLDRCDFFDLRIVPCPRGLADPNCNGCVYVDGSLTSSRNEIDETKPIRLYFSVDTTCPVVTVRRDRSWFADALPKANSVWNKILDMRREIDSFDDIV